jgi:hypothetical protein
MTTTPDHSAGIQQNLAWVTPTSRHGLAVAAANTWSAIVQEPVFNPPVWVEASHHGAILGRLIAAAESSQGASTESDTPAEQAERAEIVAALADEQMTILGRPED